MMEDVDRPLMSLGRYEPLQRRGSVTHIREGQPSADSVYITPEMVKPESFYSPALQRPKSGKGDFISSASPPDLCWMEAILGCPIRGSVGVPWSEPFLKSCDDLDTVKLDPENEWVEKLLEFTRFLAEEFQVKRGFAVTQPLFRGPIDMAVAALGPAVFCASVYKAPDDLRKLLEICTDINIKVSKMRLELTPKFHGGYVCWGMWCPSGCVTTQADHALLLSAKAFRAHLIPHYQRLIRAFDYSTIHLHSLGSLHIVEDLLSEERLKAIQVTLDFPKSPPETEVLSLLPVLAKIKERKPLIISGPVTEEELKEIRRELSPKGLCLQLTLR